MAVTGKQGIHHIPVSLSALCSLLTQSSLNYWGNSYGSLEMWVRKKRCHIAHSLTLMCHTQTFPDSPQPCCPLFLPPLLNWDAQTLTELIYCNGEVCYTDCYNTHTHIHYFLVRWWLCKWTCFCTVSVETWFAIWTYLHSRLVCVGIYKFPSFALRCILHAPWNRSTWTTDVSTSTT